MSKEEKLNDTEDCREQTAEERTEESDEDTEFKVTVRKLELPVRPRGVLAE
jgi:hypothetical protein